MPQKIDVEEGNKIPEEMLNDFERVAQQIVNQIFDTRVFSMSEIDNLKRMVVVGAQYGYTAAKDKGAVDGEELWDGYCSLIEDESDLRSVKLGTYIMFKLDFDKAINKINSNKKEDKGVAMKDALEQIANAATPYNEREAYSWIETARKIASDALDESPSHSGQVGIYWQEYIKQFDKLNEIWNTIPEPTKTLLRQQINFYAQQLNSAQIPVREEKLAVGFAEWIRKYGLLYSDTSSSWYGHKMIVGYTSTSQLFQLYTLSPDFGGIK